MAENSAIEWTDHSWSPVWGCTQVSKAETGGGGCDNCYAMKLAHRFGYGWNGAPMREFGDDHWEKPLRWNERARKAGATFKVFPSMCDPFDKDWPYGVRERFFRLILDTPHLTWLLLTKRVGMVSKMLDADQWQHLTNVWLGATVVNQAEADRDIPKLLAVPARVRFLSIEPMLGPIDLTAIPRPDGWKIDALRGIYSRHHDEGVDHPPAFEEHDGGPRIDWVIVGGESGPGARPMHPDWARRLRDQCKAAGVAFHFKQWGEWVSVSEVAGEGHHHQFTDGATVRRIGKARAGRTLDGVEHNAFPQVS